MSYRNLKKNFNISDAEYHRLPERRQKFYVHNITPLLETARIYPVAPSLATRVEEQTVPRRESSVFDDVVTGLAIGAGIGIMSEIFSSDNDDSSSQSSFDSPSTDSDFGGGDFGGGGAGGEW